MSEAAWMYRAIRPGDEPAHGHPYAHAAIFETAGDVPENEGWVSTPALIPQTPLRKSADGESNEDFCACGRRIVKSKQSNALNVEQDGKDDESARRGEPREAHGGGQVGNEAIESGESGQGSHGQHAEGAGNGEGADAESVTPEKGPLDFSGLTDDALRDIAAETGVKLDKRWGRAKLEQALRDAR